LDENGNVLVRGPLDEFDETGKIIGHKIKTENSYKRSLGMLMGLYPDFIQNGRTYAEYEAYVDAALKNGTDAVLRVGIDKVMAKTEADGSINVNPYLMTYKDVISGKGISNSIRKLENGPMQYTTSIYIKNVRDEIVGTIDKSHTFLSKLTSEVDYVMIENMIPEGRRLKATTFQFNPNGSVEMYGLGSTMPDPNKMGKEFPAIADGTYRHVTSLHGPTETSPYLALRLFDAVAGANAGWDDVTGVAGRTVVPSFNYTKTDNWGQFGQDLPGYYYGTAGDRVAATVFAINAHKSNTYPFTPSDSGNYGGSDGCQIWYPAVYLRLMHNQKYGTFGNFTIIRSFFGDGTNGKNNYRDW
jgi:hypothetical protein